MLESLEEEEEEGESGESSRTASTSNLSPSNDSVTDFYEGSPQSSGSAPTPPSAVDYTATHTTTFSYTQTPVGSASVSPTLFSQSAQSSQAAHLRAFDEFMAKVDYVEMPYQGSYDGSHRLSTPHQDVHLMKFGQFLFANSPPPNDDASGIGPTSWEIRPPEMPTVTSLTPPHGFLDHDGLSPVSSLILSNPPPFDGSMPRPTISMNTLNEPTDAELRHYCMSYSSFVPVFRRSDCSASNYFFCGFLATCSHHAPPDVET